MSRREQPELLALGRAIAGIRRERGMGQDELAAAAGVDRRRLAALEAGRVNPGYGLLLALASGLGVRVSAFMTRAESLGADDG